MEKFRNNWCHTQGKISSVFVKFLNLTIMNCYLIVGVVS
jgi:hypothetical protein